LKTRYSSLVAIKKNEMQKKEQVVQEANSALLHAKRELEQSFQQLQNIQLPQKGSISTFLVSRHLLDAQRALIQHNQQWYNYAQNELNRAKEGLKKAMIEYEKFKYLEVQEIEAIVLQEKKKEAKSLDEIALMTFTQKQNKGVVL